MSLSDLYIAKILERAEHFDWSLQGFGMLRLYLSREVRLHVWHSRFAVDNVSTIHNHPWHFESTVICGSIRNRVYRVVEGDPTHYEQGIVCGPGGHPVGNKQPVRLELEREMVSYPGYADGYRQEAHKLHESIPEDGTITVVEREFLADTEHARVFFPLGTEWVSAEPRPATTDEVVAMCGVALAKLRSETRST